MVSKSTGVDSASLKATALKNRAVAAKHIPAIASDAISAALAAIGYVVPGGTAIAKFMEIYGERELERGRKILIEEISAGNIDGIDEGCKESLFGCSYRYFEAVRRGEYEHNLRILGEYIANGLASSSLKSSEFNFNARLIEALSRFEIRILAYCGQWAEENEQVGIIENSYNFICATSLRKRFSELQECGDVELWTALNVLASRGLLTPSGGSFWDKAEEFYYPSNHLRAITSRAGSNLKKMKGEADL